MKLHYIKRLNLSLLLSFSTLFLYSCSINQMKVDNESFAYTLGKALAYIIKVLFSIIYSVAMSLFALFWTILSSLFGIITSLFANNGVQTDTIVHSASQSMDVMQTAGMFIKNPIFLGIIGILAFIVSLIIAASN